MSAQDNLSPQQFFHGTPADLKPGDRVVPGDAIGTKHMGSDSDSSRVWISTNAYRAGAYGHRIYEVSPDGTPKSPHGNDEHYVSGAVVKREVGMGEYHEHSNRWAQQGRLRVKKRGY